MKEILFSILVGCAFVSFIAFLTSGIKTTNEQIIEDYTLCKKAGMALEVTRNEAGGIDHITCFPPTN